MVASPSIQKLARWLRTKPVLGRAALNVIPDVPRTIEIAPIGRFRIRLRRNRSFWLRDPLTHEQFMLGALRRLVRPGDTVFDIGANIGLYVRFLKTCFGADRVVAFEPMKENAVDLAANVELLGAARDGVQILRLALSDHDGSELLQVDEIMSATAVLSSVSKGAPSEGHRAYGLPPRTELVETASLDTLIQGGKVPWPDVMKIDVEGAAGSVLGGGIESLRSRRPRLAVELHGPVEARSVVSLLHGLDYFCYGYMSDPSAAARYRRVIPQDTLTMASMYDLHFVVASTTEADVAAPIEDFSRTK